MSTFVLQACFEYLESSLAVYQDSPPEKEEKGEFFIERGSVLPDYTEFHESNLMDLPSYDNPNQIAVPVEKYQEEEPTLIHPIVEKKEELIPIQAPAASSSFHTLTYRERTRRFLEELDESIRKQEQQVPAASSGSNTPMHPEQFEKYKESVKNAADTLVSKTATRPTVPQFSFQPDLINFDVPAIQQKVLPKPQESSSKQVIKPLLRPKPRTLSQKVPASKLQTVIPTFNPPKRTNTRAKFFGIGSMAVGKTVLQDKFKGLGTNDLVMQSIDKDAGKAGKFASAFVLVISETSDGIWSALMANERRNEDGGELRIHPIGGKREEGEKGHPEVTAEREFREETWDVISYDVIKKNIRAIIYLEDGRSYLYISVFSYSKNSDSAEYVRKIPLVFAHKSESGIHKPAHVEAQSLHWVRLNIFDKDGIKEAVEERTDGGKTGNDLPLPSSFVAKIAQGQTVFNVLKEIVETNSTALVTQSSPPKQELAGPSSSPSASKIWDDIRHQNRSNPNIDEATRYGDRFKERYKNTDQLPKVLEKFELPPRNGVPEMIAALKIHFFDQLLLGHGLPDFPTFEEEKKPEKKPLDAIEANKQFLNKMIPLYTREALLRDINFNVKNQVIEAREELKKQLAAEGRDDQMIHAFDGVW
jgi:hypothetical protein